MHLIITPEYLASQGLSPTFPERFWKKIVKDGPIPRHMPHLGRCWFWIGCKHEWGYGKIGSTTGKSITAHKASWILHYGPVPDGKFVCHACDNPQCSRPDHLWLGTNLENFRDAARKGRMNKGENNPNSKLTQTKVDEIRRRYKPGVACHPGNQFELAEEFGVKPERIIVVANGHGWQPINKPGSCTTASEPVQQTADIP